MIDMRMCKKKRCAGSLRIRLSTKFFYHRHDTSLHHTSIYKHRSRCPIQQIHRFARYVIYRIDTIRQLFRSVIIISHATPLFSMLALKFFSYLWKLIIELVEVKQHEKQYVQDERHNDKYRLYAPDCRCALRLCQTIISTR